MTDEQEHGPTPPAEPPRRRPVGRWLLLAALLVLIIVLVAPLVWPIPPLQDTMSNDALTAGKGGLLPIDGLDVFYQRAGSTSADCNIVLLHGFGASTFSWRDTLPDLGARCNVVAFDRPGFGLSDRPLAEEWAADENPYSTSYSADLTIKLMDALGMQRAVIVGHSAGASVAILAAARYPDRVSALILEAPAVLDVGRPVPDWAEPILRTPQMRRIGPLLARRIAASGTDDIVRDSFYDRSLATDEVIAGYRAPLRVDDWDRALWEYTIAPRTEIDKELLGELDMPVIVIKPTEDRIVDLQQQGRVAAMIRGAQLVELADAGHVGHEELPAAFESIVFRFIDDLQEAGVP